jgi:CRP-like cAMP-binding protein
MVMISAATPIELLATQVDSETLSFPTDGAVFSRGEAADAIYGVRRGIVEVINASGDLPAR